MNTRLAYTELALRNEAVFEKLKLGDIVQVMVRGLRPEGEIYRVLFFILDFEKHSDRRKGIYGVYEHELETSPSRFVCFDDIICIELVTEKTLVLIV